MQHRRTPRKKKTFSIEPVESRILLAAVPHLVKDINQVMTRPPGHIENITQVGNFAFFTAQDAAHGVELWKSDGTALGTSMVKDIWAGPDGSFPSSLVNVNGELFFTANNNANGIELWKSDGTLLGTQLVKNIRVPDPLDPLAPDLSSNPINLTNVNGTLYFQANDGIRGSEVWKSDGTEPGTQLVLDINAQPGTVSDTTLNASPSNFIALSTSGPEVVFRATDGLNGLKLWYSDGTDSNTFMLQPSDPLLAGYLVDSRFAMINDGFGTLYFTARDSVRGVELWKTLGTPESTTRIKNIFPDAASSIPATPWLATDGNGRIYFTASDGVDGFELWTTDGVPDDLDPNDPTDSNNTDDSHTHIVWDINPEGGSSNPSWLTNLNGVIYFVANDGTQYIDGSPTEHGNELWMSDGTEDGTKIVANIRPDPQPTPSNLTPATQNSNPTTLYVFQNKIYFQANDGDHGVELWVTDGTPEDDPENPAFEHTYMLKNIRQDPVFGDLHPASPDSSPMLFTAVNGLPTPLLFFQANDGVHGGELWITDGTFLGTQNVMDIYPSTDNLSVDGNPSRFVNLNGTLYFTGTFGNGAVGLFKTDGTQAGTELVKDLYPATTQNPPQNLVAVGNYLWFSAWDPVHGYELWRSDGVPEDPWDPQNPTTSNVHTKMYANINVEALPTPQVPIPPPLSSNPTNLFRFDNYLVFAANDGTINGVTKGTELWAVNNADQEFPSAPYLVEDINPGAGSSSPSQFIIARDALYFVANNGTNGFELWRTDLANTSMIKDINPNSGNGLSSTQAYLTNIGDNLYFAANNGANGVELWVSDGNPLSGSGTVLLKDINAVGTGSGSSNPTRIVNLGGIAFFYADDGIHGNELWTSNGSSGGTDMVLDINTTPNTSSAQPNATLGSSDTSLFLIVVHDPDTSTDKLFFTANDGIHGTELFWMDNNSGPFRITPEINPGTGTTYYSRPTVYNGDLYFVADDGSHGRELWRVNLDTLTPEFIFDIHPVLLGAFDNNSPMMAVGNNLYFIANDGTYGAELWKYNNTDVTAPTGTGTFDSAHGTIVLTFSEDVSASLDPGGSEIVITPNGVGPAFPATTTFSLVSYDTLTNKATFKFVPTDSNNVVLPVVPDGNWQVTVLAAGITDETNNPLAANITFTYRTLSADANGDWVVDATDLGILSANWNSQPNSGKVFSQGDFDYDGDVDINDLYLLTSHWQMSLAPPALPISTAPPKRTVPTRAPSRVSDLVSATTMKA